ncbi:hypothetical protein C4J94_3080 [Pseudomonas sp. R5-89-07]|nr:hypothetical protein C4J94_3080 [Pseudomonas sp. R5-89-07]
MFFLVNSWCCQLRWRVSRLWCFRHETVAILRDMPGRSRQLYH